jgi:hypothetical protein
MLAIVAAVLFGLALLFQLVGLSLEVINSTVLMLAGLFCLALYFAGVGSRQVTYGRRTRR